VRPSPSLRDAVVVAGLHLGVVAVCSRLAGLRTPATQAVAVSAVAYVMAAAALVAAGVCRTDRIDRTDPTL
jgi:hypothetical protein